MKSLTYRIIALTRDANNNKPSEEPVGSLLLERVRMGHHTQHW